MDFRLERLGDTFKKTGPACAVCGYDAEWILGIGSLSRLFCEQDLRDALFDAVNFNCTVPDSLD